MSFNYPHYYLWWVYFKIFEFIFEVTQFLSNSKYTKGNSNLTLSYLVLKILSPQNYETFFLLIDNISLYYFIYYKTKPNFICLVPSTLLTFVKLIHIVHIPLSLITVYQYLFNWIYKKLYWFIFRFPAYSKISI